MIELASSGREDRRFGLVCQEQRGPMTLWPVGYGTKTNSPWTAMWHGERSIGPVFGSRISFDGAGGTDLSHEALCVLPIRRAGLRYIRGRHKGHYRKGHPASLNNRSRARYMWAALWRFGAVAWALPARSMAGLHPRDQGA